MRALIKISFLLLAVAGIFMAATSSVDFGLKVGDKAPSFKLKNVDGKYYSLEDVKDANGEKPKGYILTFTCNTCPYAVMYEDRLVELHNAMAPKGYPVVAIMPNDTNIKPGDSLEAMGKRAEDKGFDFLYLIDEKQEVFPAYDNAQDASAVKTNYVMDAVASLEAGKSPDPAKTKAIGCSIKVKR